MAEAPWHRRLSIRCNIWISLAVVPLHLRIRASRAVQKCVRHTPRTLLLSVANTRKRRHGLRNLRARPALILGACHAHDLPSTCARPIIKSLSDTTHPCLNANTRQTLTQMTHRTRRTSRIDRKLAPPKSPLR